jgi:hypothetical protein
MEQLKSSRYYDQNVKNRTLKTRIPVRREATDKEHELN